MIDIDKELREIKFETAHPDTRLRQKTQQLVIEEVRKKQQPMRHGKLRWVLSSAMALAAAFIILFSLPAPLDDVCYYTVDINPSVSMKVNASQTVLEVSAENDDAVMLLNSLKLEGLSLQKALSAFVKAADEQGYLKDKGHVLVACFGDASGLTQQEIENVVSGATQRDVTALMLQSTKNEFEKAKARHTKPGIELLKKQAASLSIKEKDVDDIIRKMYGNSAKNQNSGSQNAPENNQKTDYHPSGPNAKNDQSEKNNSSGSGNSETPKNHEQESANTGSSRKDDKEMKDNSDASGHAEDKPVSGNSVNQSGSSQNSDDENKNENAGDSNGIQNSKDKNGNDSRQEKDEQNKKEDK